MQVRIFETTIPIDASIVDESADEIRAQVREYARGDRRTFDVTVHYPDGFLGDVMAAMAEIPYGETRSYGTLAAELDTAPVAVGGACGRNPVPIIVPCHRVVKTNGDLGGYSAANGVETKRRLLDFEAAECGTSPVQTRLPTE